MPKIIISDREVKKVRSRQGVYSKLSKQPALTTNNEIFEGALKKAVTEIIKDAFLEYARKRGCKPEMERLEWNLFNKSLQKRL